MSNVVINVSTHDNDTKDLNLSLEGTVLKGTLGDNESTVDLSGIIPANAKDRFLKSGRYEQGTKRLILVTGAEGEQDNEIAIPLEDLLDLSLPTNTNSLQIDNSREVKYILFGNGFLEYTPVKDNNGFAKYMQSDNINPTGEELLHLGNDSTNEEITQVYKAKRLSGEDAGYIVHLIKEGNYTAELQETIPKVTPKVDAPYYILHKVTTREINEDEKRGLGYYHPAESYNFVEGYVSYSGSVDVTALNLPKGASVATGIQLKDSQYSHSKGVGATILDGILAIEDLDQAYEVLWDVEDDDYNSSRVTVSSSGMALTYQVTRKFQGLLRKGYTLDKVKNIVNRYGADVEAGTYDNRKDITITFELNNKQHTVTIPQPNESVYVGYQAFI